MTGEAGMGVGKAIGTGFRLADPTIGDVVATASDGDRPAHVSATATTSHAELRPRILRAAAALLAMDLRRGQRIGVAMPPSADRMAVCAAIWCMGGVVVPLDPGLPQARLTMAVQGSGLRLIVHDPRGDGSRASFATVPGVSSRDLLGGEPLDPGRWAERVGQVLPDHPAAVLYGEGRQDTARGVVLSHRALLTAAQGLAARYDIGPGSSVMVPLSLNHAARLTGELAAMVAGAALCDLPAFAAPASHLILADAAVEFQQEAPPQALQPGMVLLSGDARLIRAWQRSLPHSHIFNGYVRAELAGFAMCSDPRDPPHTARTTVGRPLRGVEVMIIDPRTSMDMLLYEIGEIWVRGPSVMLRYHDDQRASGKVLDRSGFLKTGDMGYLDSEGRVIVCRDAFAQI